MGASSSVPGQPVLGAELRGEGSGCVQCPQVRWGRRLRAQPGKPRGRRQRLRWREGEGVPSWVIGVHVARVTSRLCQCCGPGEGQNRGDTPAGHGALNTALVPCERPPWMRCEHHGGLTSGGRSNAWGRGRDPGCPPELAAGVLGTPESPPPLQVPGLR